MWKCPIPHYTTFIIDQGLCQTFNGKHLDKIIKSSSWLQKFNYEFRTKVQNKNHIELKYTELEFYFSYKQILFNFYKNNQTFYHHYNNT